MDRRIPPITEPEGKCWYQPSYDELIFSDDAVMVSRDAFNRLSDYSRSIPSGVYEGKIWKSMIKDQWYLCWFGAHSTDPKLCTIYRLPLIIDDIGAIELMGGT